MLNEGLDEFVLPPSDTQGDIQYNFTFLFPKKLFDKLHILATLIHQVSN